jgi:hypothetical protein
LEGTNSREILNVLSPPHSDSFIRAGDNGIGFAQGLKEKSLQFIPEKLSSVTVAYRIDLDYLGFFQVPEQVYDIVE